MKHEKEGQLEDESGEGVVLRKVRKILHTPDGADIREHAWKIMQEVEIARGNPTINSILQISDEKKDWEEKYRKRIEASGWYGHLQTLGHRSLEEFICSEIMFIEGLLEEEREKWRLKNAGLYRQLFGETNRTYTSKELWEILDSYAPLFTEEQKKELRDNLYKEFIK